MFEGLKSGKPWSLYYGNMSVTGKKSFSIIFSLAFFCARHGYNRTVHLVQDQKLYLAFAEGWGATQAKLVSVSSPSRMCVYVCVERLRKQRKSSKVSLLIDWKGCHIALQHREECMHLANPPICRDILATYHHCVTCEYFKYWLCMYAGLQTEIPRARLALYLTTLRLCLGRFVPCLLCFPSIPICLGFVTSCEMHDFDVWTWHIVV
mmetsp:Transcript_29634/g.87672  ORF Transcript_29634/g.87672 Transcript_29634/m.87672 type:complete len:207 (-) Transcript_29634:24-644(-)